MSGEEPIQILERELKNSSYYGQLKSLRRKLGIVSSTLEVESLSRRKKPSLTYKLTEWRSGWLSNYEVSWVVKFSPKDKQDDPWYDVYEEYEILTVHIKDPNPLVPKPLHCSSEEEKRVVGTKFIIMEFVEGKSYEDASSVPCAHRQKAFSSVMKALADIHYYHWVTGYDRQYKEHTSSDSFWQSQVTCWHRNYSAAVGSRSSYYGYHGYQQQSDADRFFNTLSRDTKPSHGEAKVIHGDMNISNIIFDDQYNVKAIVDWKNRKNGDPMVDVAYFCMMFLRPQDYGHQYRLLENHPLLLGDGGQLEDNILDVYKRHCTFSFNHKLFLYAKAVCCLRLLSVMKAAVKDNFLGHESGAYKDNTSYPQMVIKCLIAAGEDYYWRSK